MAFSDFFNAILPLNPREKQYPIIVVITGGEPLLRNDLAECGLALREAGFRWSIVTNGYLYDEQMHHSLISAGMGAITVSLDGMAESHNWLRASPKSFSKAVNAIKLISGNKRLNSDVVSCIQQGNINELHQLKDLLIKLGVQSWRLFTISPVGRAANNPVLQLTPEQFRYLMDFIKDTRCSKDIDAKFSCEGFVGNYERKVRDDFFFCRAGINIASVLIDGSTSACPNLDRGFVQGNIYKDSLTDIWEKRFTEMRNREWARTGQCETCIEFKYCQGNGLHLWDARRENVLVCHNDLLERAYDSS